MLNSSWYFSKFGFHFSVLNPGRNCELWMNTLNDTYRRFGANSGHIYGTYSGHSVFRLIVWLTGINCTGRSAVCTGRFTCTFHPVFSSRIWTNLIWWAEQWFLPFLKKFSRQYSSCPWSIKPYAQCWSGWVRTSAGEKNCKPTAPSGPWLIDWLND